MLHIHRAPAAARGSVRPRRILSTRGSLQVCKDRKKEALDQARRVRVPVLVALLGLELVLALGGEVGAYRLPFGLGAIVGLVVGGVLAPISWHLVFIVSVPIGLFGTVWAYVKLRELGERHAARIDWWGNVTFAIVTDLDSELEGYTADVNNVYDSASTKEITHAQVASWKPTYSYTWVSLF